MKQPRGERERGRRKKKLLLAFFALQMCFLWSWSRKGEKEEEKKKLEKGDGEGRRKEGEVSILNVPWYIYRERKNRGSRRKGKICVMEDVGTTQIKIFSAAMERRRSRGRKSSQWDRKRKRKKQGRWGRNRKRSNLICGRVAKTVSLCHSWKFVSSYATWQFVISFPKLEFSKGFTDDFLFTNGIGICYTESVFQEY